MDRRQIDPVIAVFWVLIVLSVPTIAELAHHYPSLEQRIRHARPMVRLPAEDELLALVTEPMGLPEETELRPVYAPEYPPRTGIAGASELRQHGELSNYMVVLRHDIACGKCRDLLAVALYDASFSVLQQVTLIEPFESEAGPVDAVDFLGGLAGRLVSEQLRLGGNVDGISGATNSAEALVERLNEVAVWLRANGRPGSTRDPEEGV